MNPEVTTAGIVGAMKALVLFGFLFVCGVVFKCLGKLFRYLGKGPETKDEEIKDDK